ncbi:Na(+)-translocating NADH-quinone reductase subunit A [Histidinibacterium aquaticum]|uniref:Na(+)-translocating NADH-quinone reductase subunit A n=1 Tax=Histidinibacterium aquaticum TaxID=2613962 RepID=A0A5J5GMP3_9RHOB|nr:Na(+)-translocating NADH-quinone reductase subunit A [Histidinibacterium aquaticum]KAA9009410.1 Na(+)-translocating NADH-quinone reductase subunit A [Histidinibacterium aquaticum]
MTVWWPREAMGTDSTVFNMTGYDLRALGAPPGDGRPCRPPTRVGLVGSDYPGLRLKPCVEAGDRVRIGDPVLRDGRTEDLVITAPVSGVVEEIAIGARRSVRLAVIRIEGEVRRTFDPAGAQDEDGLRTLMRESGLWSALLRRPFGRVPVPDERPAAILVPAMTTEPGAADPRPAIEGAREDFHRGLTALTRLTDGLVHVAQAPGSQLSPAHERIRPAVFRGGHPVGLPGLQIERLCPPSLDRPVWQIGHLDVIDLGRLLADGSPPKGLRQVALGGEKASDARVVALPPGADLEELALTESEPGPHRCLSGSPLSGTESRFLRRRHLQASFVVRSDRPAPPRHVFGPAKVPALVPHAALSRALGRDLPAIPLLRALSVGDTETAASLGALSLLEEDMALATYLSGATEDFGACLRRILDKLETGS